MAYNLERFVFQILFCYPEVCFEDFNCRDKQTMLRRSVSRRQLANIPFKAMVTRCTEKRNMPAVIAACSHEQVISRGLAAVVIETELCCVVCLKARCLGCAGHVRNMKYVQNFGGKHLVQLYKICSFTLVRPPVEHFSSPHPVERRFS